MTHPQTVQLRRYHPGDLDALIDLFRASARIVARRDYSDEQIMAWAPDTIDREAWAIRCGDRHVWIAEIDAAVVGFSDLETDGHVDMMYVHPDYQGRGIAAALLEQIEMAARGLGIARLYTEASITARPFFERRGFRLVVVQTVSLRGQNFINYRMEKDLR